MKIEDLQFRGHDELPTQTSWPFIREFPQNYHVFASCHVDGFFNKKNLWSFADDGRWLFC